MSQKMMAEVRELRELVESLVKRIEALENGKSTNRRRSS